MAQITKEQIKRVYALASGLGLVESNNKNDMLHELLFSTTGKTSVSDLTDAEFKQMQSELINRMKLSNITAPLKRKKDRPKDPDVADMMTQAQQSLAWRLIYRLQELDRDPIVKDNGITISVSDRMKGAIEKVLDITPNMKSPFKWVTFVQGEKFIEQLKRYVRSAERKENKLKEVQ